MIHTDRQNRTSAAVTLRLTTTSTPKQQGRVRSRFLLRICALLLLGAIFASCEDPSGGVTPSGKAPGGKAPGGKAPGGKAPSGEAPSSESPSGKSPSGDGVITRTDKPVEECVPEPAPVLPRIKWEKIALGETHVLAINEKGELYAWGSNGKGELGIGTTYESSVFPHKVEYVIIPGGTANPTNFIWESDGTDQRGSGWIRKEANSSKEIEITGADGKKKKKRVPRKWIDIAAGKERSFAINEDGELYAWGHNYIETLGFGGTAWISRSPKRPTRVGDKSDWVSVGAGRNYNIAINKDGELYRWGHDLFSDDLILMASWIKSPTRTGTENNWKFVAAGQRHILAINEDGELYALGNSRNGKLGLGKDGTSAKGAGGKLTRVGDRSDWKFAAAGTHHSLAINEAGELYGWGHNLYFALGLGGTEMGVDRIYEVFSPTKLDERTNWMSVAAGGKNSFAVNAAGELYGGGREHSWKFMDEKISPGRKIKDGRDKLIRFPSRIGDAANWKSVFVSNIFHDTRENTIYGLAMDTNQHLYSWGDNSKGQLGTIVMPIPSPSVH